jgi:hypothetical protein
VAKSAIHGVELDALNQVIVIGHERVSDARSMALHGSVCGAHGQVLLPMRRFDVGRGRKETEQREAESAEDENQKGDDYSEKKLAHEASEDIVAEAWVGG